MESNESGSQLVISLHDVFGSTLCDQLMQVRA